MATRRTRSGSSTLVASRKNSKSVASVTSDAENDAASQGTGVGSEKKVGRTRTKAAVTNTKTKRISSSRRKERIFCLCRGKDDGSAMIRCEGGCSNWCGLQATRCGLLCAHILVIGFISAVFQYQRRMPMRLVRHFIHSLVNQGD